MLRVRGTMVVWEHGGLRLALGVVAALVAAAGGLPAGTAQAQQEVDEDFELEEPGDEDEAAEPGEQTVDDDFDLEEEAEDRDVVDASAAERGEDDVDLMTDDLDADRLGDEQALVEEQVGVEERRSSIDPYEEKGESYFFLGGFYRHTFQPDWMLNWFFQESTATDNGGGGLEFTWRKNSFSVITQVWYQRAATDGPYRANGDPIDEIEFIDADLHAVFASATFLWATDFNDIVALEYGVGVGIGGVFGDLRRTEGYPVNGLGDEDPSRPGQFAFNGNFGGPYAPCDGVDSPLISDDNQQFCDDTSVEDNDRGGHFGVLSDDVPPVWPWVSLPHLGLRIKPIHQLVIRIEGGFSTLGPFLGGSVAYGF